MAELKLYPSGFLGSAAVAQSKPMTIATTASMLFNKHQPAATSLYTANEEVNALWMDMASGAPEFKTFEFKERILRCALQAFGTATLFEWIELQDLSPSFTDLHARWIDETLLYIFAGKRREMSDNNWRALLKVGGVQQSARALSPVVRALLLGERLGADDAAMYRKAMTLHQFIHAWILRPNGIVDLVAALCVLFGKR